MKNIRNLFMQVLGKIEPAHNAHCKHGEIRVRCERCKLEKVAKNDLLKGEAL